MAVPKLVRVGSDQGGELGSLLSPADAEAGRNFLTPGIADLARRSAGNRRVEPKRLRGNLLSSQPMAFNLFGALCIDPDLARRLVESMVGRSLWLAVVELEVTPADKALHLNDETSFDALIRYVASDGSLGAIAVETKLTESFSPVTASTNADRQIYRSVAETSGLYRDSADKELATSACWQMWRNHLLLERYCENAGPAFSDRQAWVVRHQHDREGAAAIDQYRSKLIAPETSFREWTLLEIADLWQRQAPPQWAEWIEAFRDRYVDLSASNGLARAAGWPLNGAE